MYFRFYDFLDIDYNTEEALFITRIVNLSTKAFYKDFNNETGYQWAITGAIEEVPNLIFEVHDNCVAIEYEEGHSTHIHYLTNMITEIKSYIEKFPPEIRTKLLSYIVHKN